MGVGYNNSSPRLFWQQNDHWKVQVVMSELQHAMVLVGERHIAHFSQPFFV
jgi:hypothetical protein